MSNNTIAMQRDAAENALRAVDFWLDELGCGYAVEGSTLRPSDVAEAVAQAVSTLRKQLSEERAAHLATRQELSMALAQLAHARAEREHMTARDAVVQAEIAALNTQLDDGEAEVDRLREALEEATQCGCETCHAQARAALTGKEKP